MHAQGGNDSSSSNSSCWRTAANLQLLLGDAHPPACLTVDATETIATATATKPRAAAAAAAVADVLDARNTASFRTTGYCGVQDATQSACVRAQLMSYYAAMLRRIDVWSPAQRQLRDGNNNNNNDDDDDDDEDRLVRVRGILTDVHDPSAVGDALRVPWELYVIADVDDEAAFVRAWAALTRDAPAFVTVPVLDAATCNNSNNKYNDEASDDVVSAATRAHDDDYTSYNHSSSSSGLTRLSLYTRLTTPFTGVYAGMAVGVVGEACQRDAMGALTGLLVHRLVLPSRPVLPWRRLPRRLLTTTSATDASATTTTAAADDAATTASMTSYALRIHFCAAPFPRRDAHALLRAVTLQALRRGAQLLIVGGPLVPPCDAHEQRTLLPRLGQTFADMLDAFVDTIEHTLETYYSSNEHHNSNNRNNNYNSRNSGNNSYHEAAAATSSAHRLRVLLVSHRGDVTQVPVLPTTMYALQDSDHVLVRSNPCRLSLCGVHVGVCNDDVVSDMRERMLERGMPSEGSLRRVVEALVQSRVYTPLYTLPASRCDVRHLSQLHIAYAPATNELRDLVSSSTQQQQQQQQREQTTMADTHVMHDAYSTKTEKENAYDDDDGPDETKNNNNNNSDSNVTRAMAHVNDTWQTMLALGSSRKELDDDDDDDDTTTTTTTTRKRVKRDDGGSDRDDGVDARASVVECMPHILFLPSTRPAFAVVTHRGIVVPSAAAATTKSPLRRHKDDDDSSNTTKLDHDTDDGDTAMTAASTVDATTTTATTTTTTTIVDESDIDDVAVASGVLAVNPGVWSRRVSPHYELRVAEVTMADCRRVVRHGASPATGVTCGLLHIYNSNNNTTTPLL